MTIVIERVLVSEILDGRTPLILVSGWNGRTEDAARSLLRDGTVVVHHDLDLVHEGVVRRTVTTLESGAPRERLGILELAHGCISCTLREDLLPLLRRLHARSSVQRIVLHLDRRLEPEARVLGGRARVGGRRGGADRRTGLAGRAASTASSPASTRQSWLADATGDEALDDDRTVAQVAVGQVDFADALVVSGSAGDGWQQARLHAVLARLAPGAPILWDGETLDIERAAAATSRPTRDAASRPTPTRRCCADSRRCPTTAASCSSSSPPPGRSTPSDCTRRSTCCSTASSRLAAACGSRRSRTRRCGSNRPVGDCGWPAPTAGWPR